MFTANVILYLIRLTLVGSVGRWPIQAAMAEKIVFLNET